MNVAFVSCLLSAEIIALVSLNEFVLAICVDGSVNLLERARLQKTTFLPLAINNCQELVAIQVFGERVVILLKEAILVHNSFLSLDEDPIVIELKKALPATCFAHPITYLNKILVGYQDGSMQLINVNSRKIIYDFKTCIFDSPISCIEPSPIVDIVAVGLSSGTVWLCDVKKDELLFSLQHRSPIKCISFRNEPSGDASQLIVGDATGRVSLWDLNDHNLFDYWQAHKDGPIYTMCFLKSQPIILTTGHDNSIKEWIIEDGQARLLKSRSGHSSPPSLIRFYGDGEAIISASQDRSLRYTSLIKDSQSGELSQGAVQSIARKADLDEASLKFEPVVSMDLFCTKDLKWDNVVTAHANSSVAHTWRADHRKVGKHELTSQDKTNVSCVVISACGNYCLLGCASGALDIFNIQSGQFRKRFTCAHVSPILSIGVDMANTYVVSIHKDGAICCMEFASCKSKFNTVLGSPIYKATFVSEAELLLLALEAPLDDERHPSIVIFDIEGQQIVRRFTTFSHRVTDLSMSNDCRWLIASSEDGSIRTWDIATGLMIDCLTLPSKPTSLAMSPTMHFLAYTLQDDVGIHLMTNTSLYRPISIDTSSASLTTFKVTDDVDRNDLSSSLTQLSLEPRQKSMNLYHLNEIKARNKPILPAKTNGKAPFFLDSLISSSAKRTDPESHSSAKRTDPESHSSPMAITKQEDGGYLSKDLDLAVLLSDVKDDDLDGLRSIFCKLQKMNPSQIDFEINYLMSIGETERFPSLRKLLKALIYQIKGRKDYEMAMALFNSTLRGHYTNIVTNGGYFQDLILEAQQTLRTEGRRLDSLFHEALLLTSISKER